MPRSDSALAAGTNTDAGSLSSTPCESPLGDSRTDTRPAPATAITASVTSRSRRMRFSGEPP